MTKGTGNMTTPTTPTRKAASEALAAVYELMMELRSLAAEGLRHATGSDPAHLHELPVQFAGQPSAWAQVFNFAVQGWLPNAE